MKHKVNMYILNSSLTQRVVVFVFTFCNSTVAHSVDKLRAWEALLFYVFNSVYADTGFKNPIQNYTYRAQH